MSKYAKYPVEIDGEFDFVASIGWDKIARDFKKTLIPDLSIGYGGGDFPSRFGARTTDGGLIVWDDGSVEVMNASEFEQNQLTHGRIVFP